MIKRLNVSRRKYFSKNIRDLKQVLQLNDMNFVLYRQYVIKFYFRQINISTLALP
jgi:hypothetical protein